LLPQPSAAEQDLARAESLFAAGAIAQTQVEAARLSAEQKTAQLSQAQLRLIFYRLATVPNKSPQPALR
jgi:outer membrane protein TolC